MKVCFVVNKFPNITETFVLNRIAGMKQRGCKVSISAFAHDKSGEIHSCVHDCDLMNDVRFMMPALVSRIALNTPKPLFDICKIIAPVMQRLPLKSASSQGQPDIIHCCHMRSLHRALRIKRNHPNARLVLPIHGNDLSVYGNVLSPSYFNEIDLALPVCESLARRLELADFPPEKIHVLYTGIDCDFFLPNEREITDFMRSVTVGRLVEKKGHETVIKAYARLVKNGHENLSHTIVGDGPLKPVLSEMIRQHGLERFIEIRESMDGNGIKRILQESHMFILASCTAKNGDTEGMPVALKEAMAMKLPVISTIHSGIPELISHDISGLLIEEKDVSALMRNIILLGENVALRTRLGEEARALILRSHAMNSVHDELLTIYESLQDQVH